MPQSMYAARARLAALQRHRPNPDDPDVTAARSGLREAKLAEEIRREADADPPLTPDQRARLAVLLLRPAGDGQGGGHAA
jgi:hypothetical protein